MRHITGKTIAAGYLCAVVCLLSACSTPKHTNTLIFGTSTKFALDVSQDTSGGVGVTVGYKRQEAVWMPLLANQAKDTESVPAKCRRDSCKEFEGTAGTGGGAAGAGARDTYSVLATFSGQASGSSGVNEGQKPGATAGGTLAQYFATGFAARLLAERGGASIVNTAGSKTETTTKAETVQAAKKIIAEEDARIERVMFSITDKEGKLDTAKYNTLLGKAKLDDGTLKLLKQLTTAKDVNDHLTFAYAMSGKPLFDALE